MSSAIMQQTTINQSQNITESEQFFLDNDLQFQSWEMELALTEQITWSQVINVWELYKEINNKVQNIQQSICVLCQDNITPQIYCDATPVWKCEQCSLEIHQSCIKQEIKQCYVCKKQYGNQAPEIIINDIILGYTLAYEQIDQINNIWAYDAIFLGSQGIVIERKRICAVKIRRNSQQETRIYNRLHNELYFYNHNSHQDYHSPSYIEIPIHSFTKTNRLIISMKKSIMDTHSKLYDFTKQIIN